MLYQGIIGGGSSPVEPVDLSPVLLWTNPSPNDIFAQTSLTLDLSNYTAILVEYGSRTKNNPGNVISGWYCKIIDLPNSNKTNTNLIGTDNSNGASGRRIWYETSTKTLTIGANYGTNETNNQAIPYNIYGVKEYVVEPIENISIGESSTFSNTINCNIGDYFILMSNGIDGTANFNNLTGADKLRVFSSSSAYCCICKATSTTISTGTTGAYAKINLN